jgi:hypothetical protein
MSANQVSSNSGNFFGVRVSKPGINVSQATPTQLILQDDYSTRTYYDQNGLARILIGLLPDGTYGLVISKPGFDVNKDVFGV